MLKTEDLNNELPWFEDSIIVLNLQIQNMLLCAGSPWVIKRQHKTLQSKSWKAFSFIIY